MGIFDAGGAQVVEEVNPKELAQRVSESLNATVRINNIASTIDGNVIKLMGQSRAVLEITCEATNAFRLDEDYLGNHLPGLPTQAVTLPRWGANGPTYTQDEMAARVKTWLQEQRS
jgi:hypothetical protein